MSRRIIALLARTSAVLAVLLLSAAPAQAHIDVSSTTPDDGVVVEYTPGAISLQLTQAVQADDIDVTLHERTGKRIPFTDKVVVEGRTITAKPPTLEEGTYVVLWQHRGADGHLSAGQISFSVGVPSGAVVSLVPAGTKPLLNAARWLQFLVFAFIAFAIARGRWWRGAAIGLALADAARLGATMAAAPAPLRPLTEIPEVLGWLLTAVSATLAFIAIRRPKLVPAAFALGVVGESLTGHLAGISLLGALGAFLGAVHLGTTTAWVGLVSAVVAYLRTGEGRTTRQLTPALAAVAAGAVVSGAMLYLLRTRDSSVGALLQTVTTPYGAIVMAKIALLALLVAPLALVARRLRPGRTSTAPVAEAVVLCVVLAAGAALGAFQPNPATQTRAVDLLRAPASTQECVSTSSNPVMLQTCLIRYVRSQVVDTTPSQILKQLAELRRSEPVFMSLCHTVTHALGRASYVKYGNVVDAFENGYDICDFGYYHGVVEGAGTHYDDEHFEQAMDTMCEELAAKRQELASQCYHGLGHAAALRVNNDLMRGLLLCEGMSAARVNLLGATVYDMCATGVTMEWFTTASEAFKAGRQETIVPRVDAPEDACPQLPERFQAACTEYVSNSMLHFGPDRVEENTVYCDQFRGYAQERCFWGIGRAVGGFYGIERIEEAFRDCSLGEQLLMQAMCMEGAGTMMTIDLDTMEPAERWCTFTRQKKWVLADQLCERITSNARSIVFGEGDGKTRFLEDGLGELSAVAGTT